MIRLISLGITREAQETEREKGGKCSARTLHSRDGCVTDDTTSVSCSHVVFG